MIVLFGTSIILHVQGCKNWVCMKHWRRSVLLPNMFWVPLISHFHTPVLSRVSTQQLWHTWPQRWKTQERIQHWVEKFSCGWHYLTRWAKFHIKCMICLARLWVGDSGGLVGFISSRGFSASRSPRSCPRCPGELSGWVGHNMWLGCGCG